MERLEIAYDLFVIMIGLAALSIVVFWAAWMGETISAGASHTWVVRPLYT